MNPESRVPSSTRPPGAAGSATRLPLAAALDALPFEAAVVDRDGFIVFANARWRVFGDENGSRHPQESIGENYFEATARGTSQGAPGAQEALALLEDALQARPHDREVVYPCAPPGQTRWFSMRAAGYDAPDGARYAVVTHEDITDRVEAELHAHDSAMEIADVARGLRSRNRDLESFGHMVSHDLQAPLRALDMLCDVVAETLPAPTPDPTRRALERIRREVARISALVEGLLALSRVAERDLRRTRVDLSAVARELLDGMRQSDPERHVVVEVQDGLMAEADPVLARLLLVNLLSNAWKYTAKRERARIEVGRQEGRGFYVRDNGIGFALAGAASSMLFEPFRRTPEAAGFEGTGMGLATVARIVERHGGRAWAEGKTDAGATFWFTFDGP